MAGAGVFGLVACFLLSFALVGAAFFAWWAIRSELKAIPDVKSALAPLELRMEELRRDMDRLQEAPASLRKRIDEAEEASRQATKKIESFTGQVGAMKRYFNRNSSPDADGEESGAQQLVFPAAAHADPDPSQAQQAQNHFGKTLKRKAG